MEALFWRDQWFQDRPKGSNPFWNWIGPPPSSSLRLLARLLTLRPRRHHPGHACVRDQLAHVLIVMN